MKTKVFGSDRMCHKLRGVGVTSGTTHFITLGVLTLHDIHVMCIPYIYINFSPEIVTKRIPILFFANKMDCADAISPVEVGYHIKGSPVVNE